MGACGKQDLVINQPVLDTLLSPHTKILGWYFGGTHNVLNVIHSFQRSNCRVTLHSIWCHSGYTGYCDCYSRLEHKLYNLRKFLWMLEWMAVFIDTFWHLLWMLSTAHFSQSLTMPCIPSGTTPDPILTFIPFAWSRGRSWMRNLEDWFPDARQSSM